MIAVTSGASMDGSIGDEGGKGVATAVETRGLFDNKVALFVD